MAGAPNSRPLPASLIEAALVARRFYLDDKQKSEIAEELGISRFKVARLLEEAKGAGIVRITVELPSSIDLDLGERVSQRFGVRRVITVRAADDEPEIVAGAIGTAAAEHLDSILGPQDVLGVAWGRSLARMADTMRGRSGAEVVQVVGGVRAPESFISGVELTRRVAERTGGRAHPLLAPLLVQTADMATALRGDPSLADAIGRFDAITVAAVGVGSWDPPNSALFNEFTHAERAELRSAGVVADVSGIVLDGAGRVIEAPVTARMIGISAEQLRRVPEVVAIAGGAGKGDAVAAVLRSGLVSTLVTDTATAEHLLESHV